LRCRRKHTIRLWRIEPQAREKNIEFTREIVILEEWVTGDSTDKSLRQAGCQDGPHCSDERQRL